LIFLIKIQFSFLDANVAYGADFKITIDLLNDLKGVFNKLIAAIQPLFRHLQVNHGK